MKTYLSAALLLLTNCTVAQLIDFEQFYYSQHLPEELNSNSEEKVRELYNDYIAKYTEKTKVDLKDFVYDYNFFNERLNRSGDIFYGDEISTYLNALKDSILVDKSLRNSIRVYLTTYPYFNAFTNDFGGIYVNIGAISHVKSEEELMYLLAHEIGHVLMRHSHKTVELVVENENRWRRGEGNGNFEYHQFSQTQELQADSLAFSLLNARVDPSHCLNLINSLEGAGNPVISGKVDAHLLCANHKDMSSFIEARFRENEMKKVFYPIIEEDSLSTHPSIDKRKENFNSLIKSKFTTVEKYTVSGNFNRIKNLSNYLLFDSYFEHEMYDYALDLALKLRTKADNAYLIEKQMQSLAALAQQKRFGDEQHSLLNLYGNSTNDEDFLRLRYTILEMSDLDFHLLNTLVLPDLRKQTGTENFAMDDAIKKNYQILYLGNEELFLKDESDKFSFEDYNAYLKKKDDSQNSEESESESDADVNEDRRSKKPSFSDFDALKEGYHPILALEKSALAESYITNTTIDSVEQTWLLQAHKKANEENLGVESKHFNDMFISPRSSLFRFRRGRFIKAPTFDFNKQTVLIQSENLFFNSFNYWNYRLNQEKTFELETKMASIFEQYPSFKYDLSNRSQKGVSVRDNYLHRLLNTYLDHATSSQPIVYTPVYAEVKKNLADIGSVYLVSRTFFATKNRGQGPPSILNYYEVYLDVDSQTIAYIVKVASKTKPGRFNLENLVYLANEKRERL